MILPDHYIPEIAARQAALTKKLDDMLKEYPPLLLSVNHEDLPDRKKWRTSFTMNASRAILLNSYIEKSAPKAKVIKQLSYGSYVIPNQIKSYWVAEFEVNKKTALPLFDQEIIVSAQGHEFAHVLIGKMLESKNLTDEWRESIHDLWVQWAQAGMLEKKVTLSYVIRAVRWKRIEEIRRCNRAFWCGDEYENAKALFCKETLSDSSLVPGEAAQLLRNFYHSEGLKTIHAKALFLRTQGYNYKEIGKQLKTSHACVRKWFSDPIDKFLKDKGIDLDTKETKETKKCKPSKTADVLYLNNQPPQSLTSLAAC